MAKDASLAMPGILALFLSRHSLKAEGGPLLGVVLIFESLMGYLGDRFA